MVSQKIDIGYIQIAYQFPGQSLLKKLYTYNPYKLGSRPYSLKW